MIRQNTQLHQVIEAHQASAGAFVVTALALEVIEAAGLERRRDHRQKGHLHTDHLNAEMVGVELLMLKALAGEPAAHRAGLRDSSHRGRCC